MNGCANWYRGSNISFDITINSSFNLSFPVIWNRNGWMSGIGYFIRFEMYVTRWGCHFWKWAWLIECSVSESICKVLFKFFYIVFGSRIWKLGWMWRTVDESYRFWWCGIHWEWKCGQYDFSCDTAGFTKINSIDFVVDVYWLGGLKSCNIEHDRYLVLTNKYGATYSFNLFIARDKVCW